VLLDLDFPAMARIIEYGLALELGVKEVPT
jgi:hypothetical protein